MVIIESLIQSIWTADFRKLESVYGAHTFKVGALYVPLPELISLLASAALSFAAWAVLRHTDLGKALRASAEPSHQQARMKTCNEEAGRKELHGDERRAFMSSCLKG